MRPIIPKNCCRSETVFQGLPTLQSNYHNPQHKIWLYQGNCLRVLDAIATEYPDGIADCIWADPPYFLSNGGTTCRGGRQVTVDKADWDRSRGVEFDHQFNTEWLQRCQRVLKPNGTIWVTGTYHNIHSVGFAMLQLGFTILNEIAWQKPNPPPNLGCRRFTAAHETILWAAKNAHARHRFNYSLMRQLAGGKQMKTVWTFTAPGKSEKLYGRHPTQKPVALVQRCILASTRAGDLVLDPFSGSGTTQVVCRELGRRCVGVELELSHLQTAIKRIELPYLMSRSQSGTPIESDETLFTM